MIARLELLEAIRQGHVLCATQHLYIYLHVFSSVIFCTTFQYQIAKKRPAALINDEDLFYMRQNMTDKKLYVQHPHCRPDIALDE